ncbi:MAG: hypothetical protein WKF48_05800 [Solirubrobacteraceae bacterium]
MTRPVVPAAADALYTELAISQPGDDTRGWPLLILLGAIGHALAPRLYDLVRDSPEAPGWTRALSPTDTPAWVLPWLGHNFAGVTLTPGTTEAAQREEIISPPAFERGTATAMTAAASSTLTGTKQVRFYERTPIPYDLLVVTHSAETPDPVATLAALASQKPAGLILTYAVSDAPLINEMTRQIDLITADIDSLTIADVT